MALDRDQIVDRIQKLLRLADQSKNPTAEAVLALAKAQQMMDEHNISSAEVAETQENGSLKLDLDMYYGEAHGYTAENVRQYLQLIGQSCEKLTTTRVLCNRRAEDVKYGGRISRRTRSYVMFLGHRPDVEVACELFRYLMKSCHTEAKHLYGNGYSNRHRAFGEGFALAVWKRVNQIHAQRNPSPESDTLALVVRSKTDTITKWMADNMKIQPPPEGGENHRATPETARAFGYVHGRSVDLGTERRLPGEVEPPAGSDWD
jgi:hypothetical protein